MDEIKRPNFKRTGDSSSVMGRDSLIEACRQFLQAKIPLQNIIPVETFEDKFSVLFNAEAVKALGPADSKKVFDEYNRTFSLQHPIKVFGDIEKDPENSPDEVVYFEEDQEYHKVLYTIPPVFTQLHTLNELDAAGPTLIDSFFNFVSKSDNPVAKADAEMYGMAIMKAITIGNPEGDRKKAEAEADAAMKDLLSKRGTQVVKEGGKSESGEAPKKSQSGTDAMPDCIDWF